MMKYKITLNNRVYEIEVEKGEARVLNEYDKTAEPAAAPAPAPAAAPAPAPAPAPAAPAGAEPITSPLPGSILSIPVKEGQSVQANEVLIVLEAMKMENEVVAPRAGTVRGISVTAGAMVNTGDLLMSLE